MESAPQNPSDRIELLGVSTHNLKEVDAAFPLGKITVVTGVSGSGKSSLVFDTLYGESYRRYVESLSSYARQYLKALPKPAIRAVRNLPAAISVRQTRSGASNRSTVGTATELNDLLRIIFVHLGVVHCRGCGKPVVRDSEDTVAAKTLDALAGAKVMVAAPLDRWGKVAARELKSQLEAQGFSRLRTADGRLLKLEAAKAADLKGAAVVLDRFQVSEDAGPRLREAAALAFRLGRGVLWILPESGEPRAFSQALDCPDCGRPYREPSSALLSFNHPLGACPACQGFGAVSVLDLDRVIPDRAASLEDDGVACWNFGAFAEYYNWARASAKKRGLPADRAFSDYTDEDWEWLRSGDRKGQFDGIDGFFAYLDSKKYKAHYRIHAARFRRYERCGACDGDRLNEQALAVRVNGRNLAEVCRLAVDALHDYLGGLGAPGAGETPPPGQSGAPPPGAMGVAEALDEAMVRLRYLRRIGVGYLTVDRSARTLSGGELQRINMARCLGSALTDTLYCLDEPSAGLHARDSANLLGVIRELRDQGNTVVLVEHERRLIEGADHLIRVGPGAGHEGGRVTYAGPPAGAPGGGRPAAPEPARAPREFLRIEHAGIHNLRDLTAKIPVGAVTAVCGVSGSGKSSLIQHSFYPAVARLLGQDAGDAGPAGGGARVVPPDLVRRHDEVMLVSQAALTRSSRSNIATYLGMMEGIRKLFAAEPLARHKGLKAGAFSFNTATKPGGSGRCETCRGLGTVTEDLSFLGEMEVRCPVCEGRRFTDDVLEVEFQGRNLIQILGLTVAEARTFFAGRPELTALCDQVMGLGLGYVTLGQTTSSFSGGEAQRLKLLALMKEVRAGKPQILIFDEPTTGLADSDVSNLIIQLRQLSRHGHTVVVVEHHLDVLRAADWLIEVGPGPAAAGGTLVYEGPPAGLKGHTGSVTAPWLWPAPADDSLEGVRT